MSLSNQDAFQLRARLNRNSNLSPSSKTNLNAFINNKKNAFDRSTFMQQYNAKVKNFMIRDARLGKRKRSRGNLNSAMENNTGSVSGGSVNPGKRGRNSPRGPLSAVSGASNTSNNENVSSGPMNLSNNDNENLMAIARQVGKRAAENNLERNAKRRKNNSQAQAATNKAAANNARRKAVANAKKKAILARQQVNVKTNANAKARAAANKAKANANAKAAANAKARAATPANSARVSATTLGTPNQSLNNNASSPSIIKPANKRNSKDNPGKLMKEGILLEIIKQAQRTASMKNLNNLRKLNRSLNSPNSIKEYDTYAWALLYDMVKGIPDTKFEGMQITLKTLKQVHEKLRQKNAYSSGRTSGGEGNRKIFTETFNNDEIVEFMFLIWLDGSHDGYITSSFLAWLDSPTCKRYFSNRHRNLAKSFVEKFPNPTNFKDTFKRDPDGFKNFKIEIFKNIKGYDTIRKICIETGAVWFFIHEFNPGTSKQMIGKVFTKDKKTSLSSNFEKELKLGIKEILNTRQTNEIYSGGEISNLKRSGVKIVSLDMEADGDMLSEAIRNTPDFRPYITVANLIDPGKHMIKTSAGRKDVQLVLSVMQNGKVDLLNNLGCQYYMGPLNFTIMDKIKTKNGNNSSLPFFKINLSIRKGGPPITKGGRAPTLDFFDLKVNDDKVLQGATAGNARIGSPEAKMGKFMGDALQYMVVAIQNKYRGRERYFASGDGSACFMYVYFCNKLNIKPKLIIDKGDERIRTIGLRNN